MTSVESNKITFDEFMRITDMIIGSNIDKRIGSPHYVQCVRMYSVFSYLVPDRFAHIVRLRATKTQQEEMESPHGIQEVLSHEQFLQLLYPSEYSVVADRLKSEIHEEFHEFVDQSLPQAPQVPMADEPPQGDPAPEVPVTTEPSSNEAQSKQRPKAARASK